MSELAERAAMLRAAFDRVFAEAPAPAPPGLTDYLAVRVGRQHRAIPLTEVSGMHVDRRIAALPSDHLALLGLAGVRGAILPVYDLRVLLDEARPEPPRWMVVAADAPVAFAFDGFEGLVRAPQTSIVEGRAALSLSQAVDDIKGRIASGAYPER